MEALPDEIWRRVMAVLLRDFMWWEEDRQENRKTSILKNSLYYSVQILINKIKFFD